MNKTDDIEYDILCALDLGPKRLDAVEAEGLSWVGDRRWIGVALWRLLGEGKVRAVNCAPDHNHDGACVVEAVPS